MVLYPSAKEHFHALVVAALKASDCCHREPQLLTRVANLMSGGYTSADFHKGVLCAGTRLGNASISGIPIQAAIGALLLIDDDVEEWSQALMMEL